MHRNCLDGLLKLHDIKNTELENNGQDCRGLNSRTGHWQTWFLGDRLQNGSPMLSDRSLSCLSVCNVGVLWPMDGRIKMKLGTWVGLVPGHIVLDGDPAPPHPKGHSPDQFSAHVRCGQTAGWIKIPLGMEVGLGPGDFVLDVDPPPSPQKGGRAPQIFGHVYCGQTAGWIKMALGMVMGLGPGHIVLDGDPAAPPKKGAEPRPQFLVRVYCGQTAGWTNMALGMEVGLGPGHTVLDGEPAPLSQKGAEPPNFWPLPILTKRLDASRCHLVWR